jgi:curved DNA-binding protein CbpA
MQNRRNYYRVLCVQPDAPAEIIRTSYRTLMQRLRMHPDLGGDHWNAALINEAFATLNDPEKRATYDQTLRQGGGVFHAHAPADVRPTRRPGSPGQSSQAPTSSTGLVRHGHGVGACAFCGTVHSVREASARGASCTSCGSPLYPATRLHAEDHTRRAIERVPRHMPLEFCVTWPATRQFSGITQDISISGMRFSTALELMRGERIRIDCEFCSAVGIVRSSIRRMTPPPGAWDVGLEFVTLLIKQTRGSIVSKTC